jgi:hypothetical protein
LVKKILYPICLCLLYISQGYAQNCTSTNDLLNDAGTYRDAAQTPYGGFVADFTAAEKKQAVKTLKTAETDIKKVFRINGGNAHAWYQFNQKDLFEIYPHSSYTYKIGFYQHVCVNGKKITTDEYTSDFSITANPSIVPYFDIPAEYASYGSGFDVIPGKTGTAKIALLRFLAFDNNKQAEYINTGEGYFDDDRFDTENQFRDIYRTWYIIPKNKKILLEVSRKEYLESLLEFYECNFAIVSKKYNIQIREANEYLPKYEKNGNKAMYQSHLENKQNAEKEISSCAMKKEIKKSRIKELLRTQSDEWLKQSAVINPKIRDNSYCDNNSDFEKTGYFTFNEFYLGADGKKVFKWNPEYFKEQTASPATPLFFKILFRYKANTPFTLNIKDDFIKNIDFEAIKKLLLSK